MGKIYYVMGKSASGKDTIYKRLVKKNAGTGDCTHVYHQTHP